MPGEAPVPVPSRRPQTPLTHSGSRNTVASHRAVRTDGEHLREAPLWNQHAHICAHTEAFQRATWAQATVRRQKYVLSQNHAAPQCPHLWSKQLVTGPAWDPSALHWGAVQRIPSKIWFGGKCVHSCLGLSWGDLSGQQQSWSLSSLHKGLAIPPGKEFS